MNATHLATKSTLLSLSLALFAAGCSEGKKGGDGGPETLAPLCSDVNAINGKELFAVAVLPTSAVLESLIFGGMDPGTLEPINFELGFRLNALNVPVTSPADLYVRSIEYTNFLAGPRAGETDYAVTFVVCSVDVDGERHAAVEGDFAHITGLSPEFAEILENESFDCYENVGPEETVETCRTFFPASYDKGMVIPAGTLIGSAGGTGLTDYAPGFDFNLLDTRFPNNYLNPDCLGAEEGPGKGFRYGACTYEYFAEPLRSGYMSKVGQNGDLRVHDDFPCGTLSVDENGSAGGIWIREDMASVSIEDDWIGVLSNVLVLAPHPVFPGAREVISSEMLEIADLNDEGLLVEFEQTNVGDVNLSFYDMAPGTTYCLSATGFGVGGEFHYLVELFDGGASLKIERIDQSCTLSPELERIFTSAAITFVR